VLNKVMVIGNLGRDAEVRYTAGGSAVARFSVAATEKWTSKDGQRQERTEWFNCDLWGKQAESLSPYLVKGKTVYVEGKLQTDEYTDKDGQKRRNTKVRVDALTLLGGGGERQERAERPPQDSHSDPLTDDDIPF